MAATITTRIMEDGPKNTVLLVSGTEAAGSTPGYQTIILPAQTQYVNLSTRQRCASFRVSKIEWDIQAEAQYQVILEWDATVPVPFYYMIGRANKDFDDFGGIYQQSGIAGTTGGIGILTANPAATGPTYTWTLVLYLEKLGLNPA